MARQDDDDDEDNQKEVVFATSSLCVWSNVAWRCLKDNRITSSFLHELLSIFDKICDVVDCRCHNDAI